MDEAELPTDRRPEDTGEPGQQRRALERKAEAFLASESFELREFLQTAEQLERHDSWRLAWKLWSRFGLKQKAKDVGAALPEWDGSPLAGKTVLVERRMRHLGGQIRQARLLALAGAQAKECIAVVEERLEPLIGRSFPNVLVCGRERAATELKRVDWSASYETIGAYLAPDAERIAATFIPLQPPPDLTASLRARYRSGGRPVVGISWSSTNKRKELPPVSDWAWLLSGLQAQPVSLQYGQVKPHLKEFKANGVRVLLDPEVDPIADLDAHAAQVAAMDLVITISNTTAHMAGALAIPCIVILDDQRHLVWPLGKRSTVWYPRCTLIRPEGRPWREVMTEVQSLARMTLGHVGANSAGA